MSMTPEELKPIAAEWRRARRIYPLYIEIAERFSLDVPRCAELDSPVDRADREAVAALRRWLQQVDELIQPHQLRVFLQTSPHTSEISLRALGKHFLQKQEQHTAAD